MQHPRVQRFLLSVVRSFCVLDFCIVIYMCAAICFAAFTAIFQSFFCKACPLVFSAISCTGLHNLLLLVSLFYVYHLSSMCQIIYSRSIQSTCAPLNSLIAPPFILSNPLRPYLQIHFFLLLLCMPNTPHTVIFFALLSYFALPPCSYTLLPPCEPLRTHPDPFLSILLLFGKTLCSGKFPRPQAPNQGL